MSKHKPALPERLYYRLADAAEWLTKQGNKCTADDLLHFGACGYLEICASADNLFAQGLLLDTPADYTEGRIKGEPQFSPGGGAFGLFDFFAVSAWKIGLIERLTECKCDSSAFIYRRSTKGLLQVAFDGRNQREDDSRPGVFALSVTPPSKDGVLSGDPARVAVSDLWVRAEELRRFQNEGSSHVRTDPEPPLKDKTSKAPIEGILGRRRHLKSNCGAAIIPSVASESLNGLADPFPASGEVLPRERSTRSHADTWASPALLFDP